VAYSQPIFHLARKTSSPNTPKLYKLIKFGRTNINTPDYWNEEWKNDSVQRNYDELFRLILEQIPEQATVLDVGCGVGRLSKLIKQQRNAELTCLDFSSWACEQLQKEGFNTVISQLPKIPLPDSTFDIAVATKCLSIWIIQKRRCNKWDASSVLVVL